MQSVGLLLVILESEEGVGPILLPSLVEIGLPKLLVSLLDYEISKLMDERTPQRYFYTLICLTSSLVVEKLTSKDIIFISTLPHIGTLCSMLFSGQLKLFLLWMITLKKYHQIRNLLSWSATSLNFLIRWRYMHFTCFCQLSVALNTHTQCR